MRVKVTARNYDIESFTFGNKYCIAYAGCSFSEEFTFTRKNRIEMCEVVQGKKISSHWISKRELKDIINSGAIHWISEDMNIINCEVRNILGK